MSCNFIHPCTFKSSKPDLFLTWKLLTDISKHAEAEPTASSSAFGPRDESETAVVEFGVVLAPTLSGPGERETHSPNGKNNGPARCTAPDASDPESTPRHPPHARPASRGHSRPMTSQKSGQRCEMNAAAAID